MKVVSRRAVLKRELWQAVSWRGSGQDGGWRETDKAGNSRSLQSYVCQSDVRRSDAGDGLMPSPAARRRWIGDRWAGKHFAGDGWLPPRGARRGGMGDGGAGKHLGGIG